MNRRKREKLQTMAKKKGLNLTFNDSNRSERYMINERGILIKHFSSIKDLTNFLKYHDPSKARFKQLSLFEE